MRPFYWNLSYIYINFINAIKDLHQKGLSIAQIIKALGRKEIYFQKLWTFNDVGVDFMVKSAIED